VILALIRYNDFQKWTNDVLLQAGLLYKSSLDEAIGNVLKEIRLLHGLKVTHPWQNEADKFTIGFDAFSEVSWTTSCSLIMRFSGLLNALTSTFVPV
jgi:hypothetical protein